MRKFAGSIALAAALAGGAASARAAEPATVAADEVLRLTAGGGGAVLVDTRTPQECWQARIPGALCIPAEAVKSQAARLPKDRGAKLVFYCRGAG